MCNRVEWLSVDFNEYLDMDDLLDGIEIKRFAAEQREAKYTDEYFRAWESTGWSEEEYA